MKERPKMLCGVCMDCPDLVAYGWCTACKNAASKLSPRQDRTYIVGKHGQPSRFKYIDAGLRAAFPDSESGPRGDDEV